ncbi:MAG: glycogen/starch/alpha-glucan phosphorylase [Ruminococcaceae bacterium]|nr:glycogen/starch/alpha-glucan phosphorylase [Oscillospiraceae bacterium]
MDIKRELEQGLEKSIRDSRDYEVYVSLVELVNRLCAGKEQPSKGKKLYYISAEFLMGKMLSNNLLNLGIYDEVKKALEENGKSLEDIAEAEAEPSLGNGGLGRLAACFVDSMATLGLNADGVGLLYHFGLFRQVFKDNSQTELPDRWGDNHKILIPTKREYTVSLGGKDLKAKMYDIFVTGYKNGSRRLHLFDLEGVDEGVVKQGIAFDKKKTDKNLTLFLYPDDSDEDGKLLRISQQYFLVSAGAQMILEDCEEKGGKPEELHKHAVVQINDTHPAMVIPELIRLLIKKGVGMDDAIRTVSLTCAYTNHTILAEALEKWDYGLLKKAVPQLMPIIDELDKRIKKKYRDKSVHIKDENNRVHMANMAIHYGFSINGVAHLHTEILKNAELNHFYKIYPEKFNNKTNGITFRRWLLCANPQLSEYIEKLIGAGFKSDFAQLSKLMKYADDEEVLANIINIKKNNKKKLAGYLEKNCDITVPLDSVFDIQIKRLHEYKRQHLNALYLINKYMEIKSGRYPKTPITAIFGAKAAAGYVMAKDIIHLLLCLSQLAREDGKVSKYLNIVMVENYNVTKAELLIPACDISEQISLASKEASGTGNMKFMANGAVTLGTMDGANVEIHSLVGDENIYIFGAKSKEVMARYKAGSYDPKDYYDKNEKLKACVDFISGEALSKLGDSKKLARLRNELLTKDYFMALPDFEDYVEVKDKALDDYEDRMLWAKKMLMNIAKSGYFSSDRTVEEYNSDIWHLG